MPGNHEILRTGSIAGTALQQNRVLRNTYALLALSMVPTTTSAQRLLDTVLPQIAGRIEGSAVRVPTASVSAVDLAVMTERPATAEAVNAAFRAAGGVIGWTDRPLVSTDLRARPESIVMALPETRCYFVLLGK